MIWWIWFGIGVFIGFLIGFATAAMLSMKGDDE